MRGARAPAGAARRNGPVRPELGAGSIGSEPRPKEIFPVGSLSRSPGLPGFRRPRHDRCMVAYPSNPVRTLSPLTSARGIAAAALLGVLTVAGSVPAQGLGITGLTVAPARTAAPAKAVAKIDAAADTALVPETRADLRRQARLLKQLRAVQVTVAFHEASPKDVLTYLSTVLSEPAPLGPDADKDAKAAHKALRMVSSTAFLWVPRKGKTEDVKPFTCEAKDIDLVQLLEIYRVQCGVGTALARRAVLLMPEEQVKPYTWLARYNLRWAVQPMGNFPGPELGLPQGDDVGCFLDEDEESSTTVSGYDADMLEEMITTHATPDAWGDKGVALTNYNGLFLIRHNAKGHRQVQRVLRAMGLPY